MTQLRAFCQLLSCIGEHHWAIGLYIHPPIPLQSGDCPVNRRAAYGKRPGQIDHAALTPMGSDPGYSFDVVLCGFRRVILPRCSKRIVVVPLPTFARRGRRALRMGRCSFGCWARRFLHKLIVSLDIFLAKAKNRPSFLAKAKNQPFGCFESSEFVFRPKSCFRR